MFNLSPYRIAIDAAGDQELIETLKLAKLKSNPDSNLQLTVRVAREQADNWKIVYSSSRSVRQEGRYLYLVFPVQGRIESWRMLSIPLKQT